MTFETIYGVSQALFLLYLVTLTGGYLLLNVISIFSLRQYFEERMGEHFPQAFTGYEPQISIIVPAYNEAATIASSIQSLLQLRYPEYEIIVVNDGSKDDTIDVLRRAFELKPFPEAYGRDLPTEPIRATYHSSIYANVRVIDKENGGKADSLNAGINLSVYPLFCCIDADSVLAQDSLYRVVQPFLLDHRTVACGGTIRVANGCSVEAGRLKQVGLPSSAVSAAPNRRIPPRLFVRSARLVTHECDADYLRGLWIIPEGGGPESRRVSYGHDRRRYGVSGAPPSPLSDQ